MPYLARKISFAKWEPKDGLEPHEIPADAITGDLRTTDNALSLWSCEVADQPSLRRAALALAASADRVDKLDLVWVDRDRFADDGITLKETEGKTPVVAMREAHVDACALDHQRLGRVAHSIATALREGQSFRFTRRDVLHLIVEGLENRMLGLAELSEKVRVEAQRVLNERRNPQ